MSLDGYVAGPNDRPGNGMGDGGDRVHEWIFSLSSWRRGHGQEGGESNRESELLDQYTAAIGSYVMGRRMFDNGEEPWGPNPPYHCPVFIVTSRPHEQMQMEGGTTYTFVTDGIESALAQAKYAAGDKNVGIAGGAQVVQEYAHAGLLDEIELHIAPVFLGGGVRLFDRPELVDVLFEPIRVVEGPQATHIRYRVKR
jgi:dihydrofolate reductase